ncbi:hypothetical protein H8356DRAFT_1671564 [Neocallimastix lanati (nom. inval.)]|nr:hypothetical protein H8356DRAFT_1671564 [Neocallimastix sp. JGI-2020a]
MAGENIDIMIKNLQKVFEDKIKNLEDRQQKLEEYYKFQNKELNNKINELMEKQKLLENRNKELQEKIDILMDLNPDVIYANNDSWLKDNIILIQKACHDENYFYCLLQKLEKEDKVDLYSQIRDIWQNDNDFDVII